MKIKAHKLFHFLLKIPKEESAFFYFQLEACDGLAFYSTNEDSMGKGYREIDVKGDTSLEKEFLELLDSLKAKFKIEILLNKYINDE